MFYTQSQKKRNFSSWFFPGAQGQGYVTRDHEKWGFWQVITISIVEMMYNCGSVVYVIRQFLVHNQ